MLRTADNLRSTADQAIIIRVVPGTRTYEPRMSRPDQDIGGWSRAYSQSKSTPGRYDKQNQDVVAASRKARSAQHLPL